MNDKVSETLLMKVTKEEREKLLFGAKTILDFEEKCRHGPVSEKDAVQLINCADLLPQTARQLLPKLAINYETVLLNISVNPFVEIKFDEDGFLNIIIYGILPRKRHGYNTYLPDVLYPSFKEFFAKNAWEKPDELMVAYFTHYHKYGTNKNNIKDYDNLEIDFVIDAINLYALRSDDPDYLTYFHSHQFMNVKDNRAARTEIKLIPYRIFPKFLEENLKKINQNSHLNFQKNM